VHQSQSWLNNSRQATIAAMLLMAGAVACRRVAEPPRSESQQSGATREQPEPKHRQPARMLVFAAGPALAVTTDSESLSAPPEPTATYGSLRKACTTVRAIMHARLGVDVSLSDSVAYENEFVQAHRTGCELRATGKLSVRPDTVGSSSVDGDLAAGLEAAGWADIPRYTADGPDGGSFGRRSHETVCLFRFSWDGGDDSDSTYVPSDDWEGIGHCGRREAGDSV
jgi:hypothetical protein